MIYRAAVRLLRGPLRRWVMHFDWVIERSAADFAASLPSGARVLDAGAGECQYAHFFSRHRYVAVDLGIGDASWNYRKLDCVADLSSLPLASASFEACLNLVTLEHVRQPDRVLRELARVLRPGGRILLVVPHDWEVHQEPHDYFRYTVHGMRYLLAQAGFDRIRVEPAGGYFRLMSRRMLNGLQFFPGPLFFLAALFVVPPALLLPLFEPLDRNKNFTLGYVCHAERAAGEVRQGGI